MRFSNFFNLPSPSSNRNPLLGFLVALLLVFAAGCSSSDGGSFVATPGEDGNNNVGRGAVTFNFVRAQSPITVPLSTINLRFEFFGDLGGTGSVVLLANRPYADSITIEGVPDTARSVVVTALGADGFPLSEFTANVGVVANSTVLVSATDGTSVPVTLTGITPSPLSLSLSLSGSVQLSVSALFSNGDTVLITGATLAEVTFTSSNLATATVAADGTVTAVLPGETVIGISFRGQNASVPVVVSTGNAPPPLANGLEATPDTFTQPAGTITEPVTLIATLADNSTREVGLAQGVVFSSPNPGITFGNDNRISIGIGVAPGTYNVSFSYLGRSDTASVTVTSATLQSIAITPSTVDLPFGGFEQQFTVQGTFSDQTTAPLDGSAVTFDNGGSALFAVDLDGLVTTAASGTAGQGTLTATAVQPGVPSVSATVGVGAVTVNSLTINPNTLTLNPAERATFRVTANLSSGAQVDITSFAALQVVAADGSVVINGNTVVAVTPNSPAGVDVTVSLPGSGVGGADVSETLLIVVNQVTLVSARYFYAGNPIPDAAQTLNLPRGYVGIFEVEGTFSNGAVRMLTPDEYDVLKLNTGTYNPDAVQLFDENYTLRQADARFTDGRFTNGDEAGVATPSVFHIVDDFLGTVRTIDVVGDLDVARSNNSRVQVKSTFRGVVADWYRGRFIDVMPPLVAPLGNDAFTIDVLIDPDASFDRTVTVTVTDPAGGPTINSIAFAQTYNSANANRSVPVGSPREMEVRVTFPAASIVAGSLAPEVAAQPNFKLAEANVSFITDDLDGVGGPNFTDVFHHRATAVGFIGVTSDQPFNVGILNVAAVPVGGRVLAPILQTAPVFTIDTVENVHPGTETDPEAYTAGTYVDVEVFGWPSNTTSAETPTYVPSRDPGPVQVAGSMVDASGRSPGDLFGVTYSTFDNGGLGFRSTIPTVFSLDPAHGAGSPLQLQVGSAQIFRTLIRYAESEALEDVSKDFRPRLETTTNAVGLPNSTSGQLEVTGVVAAAAGATVTAYDIAGNPIVPRGVIEGAASVASSIIDIIPIP